jgi:hypothetical protein
LSHVQLLAVSAENGGKPDRFPCRNAGTDVSQRRLIKGGWHERYRLHACVIDFMFESVATPRSQALSQLQCNGFAARAAKSALNRGVPISVEFVRGKDWSNAAWPA